MILFGEVDKRAVQIRGIYTIRDPMLSAQFSCAQTIGGLSPFEHADGKFSVVV